jgi:hypothetical protein
MKKQFAGSVAGAALVLCVVATAHANDHSVPGVPGTPNCHGQTIAFLAQAWRDGTGDAAYHGIGGLGHLTDLSAQEVQATVAAFCGQ